MTWPTPEMNDGVTTSNLHLNGMKNFDFLLYWGWEFLFIYDIKIKKEFDIYIL